MGFAIVLDAHQWVAFAKMQAPNDYETLFAAPILFLT